MDVYTSIHIIEKTGTDCKFLKNIFLFWSQKKMAYVCTYRQLFSWLSVANYTVIHE